MRGGTNIYSENNGTYRSGFTPIADALCGGEGDGHRSGGQLPTIERSKLEPAARFEDGGREDGGRNVCVRLLPNVTQAASILSAMEKPNRTRRSRRRPRLGWRSIAVTFAGVALLASCGGGSKDGSAAPPTPSSAQSTAATTTATPSRSGTPAPKATSKTTGSRTAKPSPVATSTGGAIARLDRPCGRRGVDTQGVTVKTQPKGPVGFNTEYSDGSSNVDGTHHYSGGYGGGFADDAGNYRNTWVIDPNVPLGIATIRLITGEGGVELTYRVVAKDGSC